MGGSSGSGTSGEDESTSSEEGDQDKFAGLFKRARSKSGSLRSIISVRPKGMGFGRSGSGAESPTPAPILSRTLYIQMVCLLVLNEDGWYTHVFQSRNSLSVRLYERSVDYDR